MPGVPKRDKGDQTKRGPKVKTGTVDAVVNPKPIPIPKPKKKERRR